MIKRVFDSSTYAKIGHPDLDSKIYFMRKGKKIWGSVVMVSYFGFKGAKDGKIMLGIRPFKNKQIY